MLVPLWTKQKRALRRGCPRPLPINSIAVAIVCNAASRLGSVHSATTSIKCVATPSCGLPQVDRKQHCLKRYWRLVLTWSDQDKRVSNNRLLGMPYSGCYGDEVPVTLLPFDANFERSALYRARRRLLSPPNSASTAPIRRNSSAKQRTTRSTSHDLRCVALALPIGSAKLKRATLLIMQETDDGVADCPPSCPGQPKL